MQYEGLIVSKTLVVFYSATGNTRRAAQTLAQAIGADLAELEPAEPYTAADLDWRDDNSRTSIEHANRSMRPALANNPSIEGYDEIFLGYPLWWATAPRLVRTWLESHDFSGVKLTTFATSSSTIKGADGVQLHDSAPQATWIDGRRVSPSESAEHMRAWADSIK